MSLRRFWNERLSLGVEGTVIKLAPIGGLSLPCRPFSSGASCEEERGHEGLNVFPVEKNMEHPNIMAVSLNGGIQACAVPGLIAWDSEAVTD